jgi:hypothetical protein
MNVLIVVPELKYAAQNVKVAHLCESSYGHLPNQRIPFSSLALRNGSESARVQDPQLSILIAYLESFAEGTSKRR